MVDNPKGERSRTDPPVQVISTEAVEPEADPTPPQASSAIEAATQPAQLGSVQETVACDSQDGGDDQHHHGGLQVQWCPGSDLKAVSSRRAFYFLCLLYFAESTGLLGGSLPCKVFFGNES